MSVGQPGLQGAFAKTEEYGLSFHFTNEVTDKEDTGNDLIQYSFISLKEDALHWLRENGRLPSVDIDDYFEEIKEMNESRRGIKRLEEKNKALQEEKDAEISTLQNKLERIKVSEKKMRSLLDDLEKKLDDKLSSENS